MRRSVENIIAAIAKKIVDNITFLSLFYFVIYAMFLSFIFGKAYFLYQIASAKGMIMTWETPSDFLFVMVNAVFVGIGFLLSSAKSYMMERRIEDLERLSSELA